jgi:hypothetical protein
MAGASVRRPIPAVVFILLLSLLSAIVWYRVLNRSPASTPKASTSPTRTCVHTPAPKTTAAKSKPIVWPAASTVHLTVLNGTDRTGLARSVAGQLKTRGFKVGLISNDTVDTVNVTQVRYGAKSATAAKLVQLYLPGAKLVPNASKTTTVVVSLGASYRRLSTAAQVARAKKTASPAPVPC